MRLRLGHALSPGVDPVLRPAMRVSDGLDFFREIADGIKGVLRFGRTNIFTVYRHVCRKRPVRQAVCGRLYRITVITLNGCH